MYAKRKKTLMEKELTPYLIVSMIIEMMTDGNLKITDKNKIVLTNKIPTINYSKNLYEIIKNMKKEEVPLKTILTSICYGFSSKNLKNIIDTLKDKMIEDNLFTLETKKGIIKNKEIIVIDEDEFTNIIEEIKEKLLGKESLTEEIILLASLLNSTKFLKNIFNKYEKEKLKEKLKEIKDTEIAQKVKVAQSAINDMTAVITTMMINAARPV